MEICGLQLKKIDPKFLKQVPNGQIVWFTDGNANEVYFLMDKNGVQEFHLTFLGNYVEGGRNKALRAGYVVEEFDVKQTTHKGSDLLEMGPGIENEVLFLGIQLVENTEQMPKEQRELLVKLLRG